MWLDAAGPIRKRDLVLERPFVNAPGILGFAPDPHHVPALSGLGAFLTAPISARPRKPAANRSCLPFPGGFLLHTGLPNPGIRRAIQRFGRSWQEAPLPVVVHLLAEAPETVASMAQRLEGLENLTALALGLPPDCTPEDLEAFLQAAAGELPLAPCLLPDQVPALLPTLAAWQPAAVILAHPRGTLPGPSGDLVSGRLYGPALFPLTLHAAGKLAGAGLRVLAGAGVASRTQAEALLSAGLLGVSLGSVLWGMGTGEILNARVA
jgi:dihydroorotate dehydrogenase (NAD+) catalytic subunit